MLVNYNFLLKDAINRNYGVGVIECWDINLAMMAVEAAYEENSPSAILVCKEYLKRIGVEAYADFTIHLINSVDVPIALCIDECQDFNFIIKCIKSGFSLVMHEGSSGEYGEKKEPLSYEENIEITREIVKVAHAVNVSVEASLGELSLSRDGTLNDFKIKGHYTDPEKAADFVKKTSIDILAPSIGNIHSLYKDKWLEPNWKLAKEIVKKTGIVCSLHGSTGATDEQIRKAIRIGFRKINIATRYHEIFRNALITELPKSTGFGSTFNSTNVSLDIVKKEVKRMMREVYHSSGKFKSSYHNDYWTIEKINIK